jgi:hypothetical protein
MACRRSLKWFRFVYRANNFLASNTLIILITLLFIAYCINAIIDAKHYRKYHPIASNKNAFVYSANTQRALMGNEYVVWERESSMCLPVRASTRVHL